MNKILRKAATVVTAVLAISTPRSAAQYCKSPLFTDVNNIISSSCIGCHNGNLPKAQDFRPMVDHEQLWVPNSNVVAGDHASSLLWQFPKGGMGGLSQTDIDKIQNWIDNLKRTVTVLPSNGGTVTPGGTLPIGSSRNITALPNPGWTFVALF